MATATRTGRRCFLSFAAQEERHARFFREVIVDHSAQTVDVFLSSDRSCIRAGDKWYEELLSNLRCAKTVFVLLAPPFAARPWILFESGLAVALKLQIIPLRYNGLTAELVPDPLKPFQSVDLCNSEEVSGMLNDLPMEEIRGPNSVKDNSERIAKHFRGAKPPDESLLLQRPTRLLQDCVALLSVCSETQRKLFFHVLDWEGKTGILESDIRKGCFIPNYRHGEKKRNKRVPISTSEYYFRLRELYLLGLLEMSKVDEWENRWRVRRDLGRLVRKRWPSPKKKPR